MSFSLLSKLEVGPSSVVQGSWPPVELAASHWAHSSSSSSRMMTCLVQSKDPQHTSGKWLVQGRALSFIYYKNCWTLKVVKNITTILIYNLQYIALSIGIPAPGPIPKTPRPTSIRPRRSFTSWSSVRKVPNSCCGVEKRDRDQAILTYPGFKFMSLV